MPCFSHREYDLPVCLIDGRVVERGEIDARGALAVVPHRFADDGQRHVAALGYARPAVARDVGAERDGRFDAAADDLEARVDEVDGVEVLPSPPAARRRDDGQQIGRAGRGVAVDDVLHGLLPLDEQLLVGLLPAIGEDAVAQVLLLEVGHVDERHPPRVEAEHEEVAGLPQRRLRRQVECLDAADDDGRDGTLGSPAYAGVDVAERCAVGGQPALHGAVVDGTQVAHIKGRGVGDHPCPPQVGLVGCHHPAVHLAHRHVAPPATEAHEAVDRRRVGLRQPLAPYAPQVADGGSGECEEAVRAFPVPAGQGWGRASGLHCSAGVPCRVAVVGRRWAESHFQCGHVWLFLMLWKIVPSLTPGWLRGQCSNIRPTADTSAPYRLECPPGAYQAGCHKM